MMFSRTWAQRADAAATTSIRAPARDAQYGMLFILINKGIRLSRMRPLPVEHPLHGAP